MSNIKIRAITYARIMTALRWHEHNEAPDKLTLQFRSDGSGSIINDVKTVIIAWDNLEELNDVIKAVNDELSDTKRQQYNKKYYRGR